MTGTDRIRWERNDDGSHVTPAWEGYVGTIGEALFFIFEPDDRDPWWILTSQLPGLPGAGQAERRSHGDDTDKLRAEAERWLEEFVTSLGAIFPGALRSEIESMRRAKHEDADDCEHLEQTRAAERCYGAVDALDWALAAIDHLAPGTSPATAGRE